MCPFGGKWVCFAPDSKNRAVGSESGITKEKIEAVSVDVSDLNYLNKMVEKVKTPPKKFSLLRPVELALASGEDLLALFTVQWLLIIGDYS